VSAREAILSRIRTSLAVRPDDDERMSHVETRLRETPSGVIPARGQLEAGARVAIFRAMAEKVQTSVVHVETIDDVPAAVAAYLREKNLPAKIRIGADADLAGAPWQQEATLEIRKGASQGDDLVAVSHAMGAVAETGTLVLASGPDNPTTLNFLPEHHIVVIETSKIDGDLETALKRVRRHYGKGNMPRAVNMVTGPSRSGDIEQTILLGAHGPRALHVVMVG